jgi:hypothetical protein
MVIYLQIPTYFEQIEDYFSQLLNIHDVNDARHTAEPIVPESNSFKAEIAAEKLKSYVTRY